MPALLRKSKISANNRDSFNSIDTSNSRDDSKSIDSINSRDTLSSAGIQVKAKASTTCTEGIRNIRNIRRCRDHSDTNSSKNFGIRRVNSNSETPATALQITARTLAKAGTPAIEGSIYSIKQKLDFEN
jgi:hypothetical protein